RTWRSICPAAAGRSRCSRTTSSSGGGARRCSGTTAASAIRIRSRRRRTAACRTTRSPLIANILGSLTIWIQQTISAMGYAGVAGLMAIESACIPLPSEVIMPFAGSLVPSGRFTLWGCGLAGAIGCVVGSIPAYYAGAYGGRPLILRYGRYVLLSKSHLDWADEFFLRRGDLTVFVARLLPVVRTFIAFPAGVARMPMGKFVAY